LFGSDDEEEDAEAERIRNERLAEYKKKKEGKAKPAAKSVVTMDVKPWGMFLIHNSTTETMLTGSDDETDMKALEAAVRSIEKDGLVWGASKFVPVGFGIKKLQINLVIEDDKIGLDDLQEEIAEFEDYVQSSDIVSSCYHIPHLLPADCPPRLPCKSYRAVSVMGPFSILAFPSIPDSTFCPLLGFVLFVT
jgi:elongation factor 1-beta